MARSKVKTKLVYIGPGVPTSGLFHCRVFSGDLPEDVKKALDANPWIRGLFVEPAKVAEANMEVSTSGTVKNALARKVIKDIKEGGK